MPIQLSSILRLRAWNALVRHLLQNPGQVYSRYELISAAWPKNIYVEPRTVDVHISTLRKTLKFESNDDVIRTVISVGYALDDQIQLTKQFDVNSAGWVS